jgi:hypothetical protein
MKSMMGRNNGQRGVNLGQPDVALLEEIAQHLAELNAQQPFKSKMPLDLARSEYSLVRPGKVLAPEWEVVEYDGPYPRAEGQTRPAGRFSLAEGEGVLRYYVEPMTHSWGNTKKPKILAGDYAFDPGLELQYLTKSKAWLFETKVTYFLPFANNRAFHIHWYFRKKSAPPFILSINRNRDINNNYLGCRLRSDANLSLNNDIITSEQIHLGLFAGAYSTFHLRVQRLGGLLTVQWSLDGQRWDMAMSYDLGDQLDGLEQRLVLTGACWFLPADSYADYHYLTLSPVTAPIETPVVADQGE